MEPYDRAHPLLLYLSFFSIVKAKTQGELSFGRLGRCRPRAALGKLT